MLPSNRMSCERMIQIYSSIHYITITRIIGLLEVSFHSFHASFYVFPGDPQTFMILAGPQLKVLLRESQVRRLEHNCFLKPSASSASGLEGPNFLEENVAQIHKQLLLELIKPPVQFIQEALTEQLSFTTSSHQQYHPTEPNCWRWLLQCVDCQAQVLTKYGRSDDLMMKPQSLRGFETDGLAQSNNQELGKVDSVPCLSREGLLGRFEPAGINLLLPFYALVQPLRLFAERSEKFGASQFYFPSKRFFPVMQ